MNKAIAACHGLRLLRQDPWECLASFILSSTKQIVQIQQIIGLLCTKYGDVLPVPNGYPLACSFPSAEKLAQLTEQALRECKMGFRAPYLLETARLVAHTPGLLQMKDLSCEEARARLLELPGVGRKIADCVLLFAYGYQSAFPIDVWVARALKELYFPSRRVKKTKLMEFAATHFGPFSGYAQQYLFHYMRHLPRRAQAKNRKIDRSNYVHHARSHLRSS